MLWQCTDKKQLYTDQRCSVQCQEVSHTGDLLCSVMVNDRNDFVKQAQLSLQCVVEGDGMGCFVTESSLFRISRL